MVEALRRHDVGGQALGFGSFPAKTQVPSEEINTLSFTFDSVLHCFLTLPQCNVKTTLRLFPMLNNGRQECKEMASGEWDVLALAYHLLWQDPRKKFGKNPA